MKTHTNTSASRGLATGRAAKAVPASSRLPAQTAAKSATAQFRLRDAATGREVAGAIRLKGGQLAITVAGYDTFDRSINPADPAQPIIILDLQDGRLTLKVWDDKRVQNCRRLDLEAAQIQ